MSHDISLRLAKNLKTIRTTQQITQEKAAELIGMDLRYYQRLESKKPYAIRIDTLEKIAQAFKVNPADLIA